MGSSKVGLLNSDCLEAMKKMPDNSIDAIVTDPPYGLSFMGKNWDFGVPGAAFWKEALRVAKPGAHLLAFGGTRTYHRLTCAIEDAGWEIRDCCGWLYGSGFPKSMDISKAIDKKHNRIRERCLVFTRWLKSTGVSAQAVNEATNTIMARRWLCEDAAASIPRPEMFDLLRPILPPVPKYIEELVQNRADNGDSDYAKRKVLSEKDNARSKEGVFSSGFKSSKIVETEPYSEEAKKWSGWGTCLKPAFEPIVLARKPLEGTVVDTVLKYGTGGINIDECRVPSDKPVVIHSPAKDTLYDSGHKDMGTWTDNRGRFPANLIHDGSDEVLEVFPESQGMRGAIKGNEPSEVTNGIYGKWSPRQACPVRGDSGSAARFFYCAKASKSERGEGNIHPTVKPIALMEYLVKLITPEGGIVLDPFMGSGTTGIAALNLNRGFIGIEKEPEYFNIAKGRIERVENGQK